MCKILIFGGTTEGRELSEFCVKNEIRAYISVATEYGSALLQSGGSVRILTGRMDREKIQSFIKRRNISLVIDATHPYAAEATENIKSACLEAHSEYIRVMRETEKSSFGKYFDNLRSAADYLCGTSGNILFTTGSKELSVFCHIKDFSERSTARVLPIEKIVSECLNLGLKKENIIAQMGPFSIEQNINHINKYKAAFIVTKESGKAGGFKEKSMAAEQCGAELIVIKRPNDSGITVSEAERILLEKAND